MLPNLNYSRQSRRLGFGFPRRPAGQPRIDPNNDPRIVLDDFTMPDWCFLDDANPDWDAACEQINESEYQQFDVNLAWDLNDRWTFTSITGLSDFESHGITDWVMLGTEARHNDVESDVIYQELQLNVDVRSVRSRDRRCRISRRTSTAAPARARRITIGEGRARFATAGRQRQRRRQSAAGRTGCSSPSSPTACRTRSRSACSRTSLGTSPTVSISRPASATRSTRKT